MNTYKDKIEYLLNANRPFSIDEIRKIGVPSQTIVDLCKKGVIEHLCTGVYISTKAQTTENLSLQITALRIPDGVFCLLSALRFHNFSSQLSQDIWVSIRRGKWQPKINSLSVQFLTQTDMGYQFGIEEHSIDGITLKVYSPAKTVADCFKHRNKIGLDVALEALQDGYKQKLFTPNELMQAAQVCRVTKIITPYMESLLQ